MYQSYCIPDETMLMYYLDLNILIKHTISYLKNVFLHIETMRGQYFSFQKNWISDTWHQDQLTPDNADPRSNGWLNKVSRSSVGHLHRRRQWGPRGSQTIEGLLSQCSCLFWFEWGMPPALGIWTLVSRVWCCWGGLDGPASLEDLQHWWPLRFLLFLPDLPLADSPLPQDRPFFFFSC